MQPWVQGGGELPDTSPTQMKAQGGNPAAAEQFTVEKHEVPTGPNPDANNLFHDTGKPKQRSFKNNTTEKGTALLLQSPKTQQNFELSWNLN
ncbi:hypothetical protein HPP92_017333 [Vanilla planifolia]|uniref:Uncharacterized protein n=1 Tax=Vanilla planifolia TaxID=51239 RepID=A0A835Q7T7_VANPL|nr:hypothetical protein HPP92_017333 [Vanilla planifolia]